MSIRKPQVIDWLGIEKSTGDITLTVVDGEDWSDEPEHIALLEEKLNSYLAFIESGQVYKEPHAKLNRPALPSTPVRVEIVGRFPLPDKASEFVAYAQEVFKGAGFTLAHRVRPADE